jgi:hypothetical protein
MPVPFLGIFWVIFAKKHTNVFTLFSGEKQKIAGIKRY